MRSAPARVLRSLSNRDMGLIVLGKVSWFVWFLAVYPAAKNRQTSAWAWSYFQFRSFAFSTSGPSFLPSPACGRDNPVPSPRFGGEGLGWARNQFAKNVKWKGTSLLPRGGYRIACLFPGVHTAQEGLGVNETFALIFLCHTGRTGFVRSGAVKDKVRVPGNRCHLGLKGLQRHRAFDDIQQLRQLIE